MANLARHLGLFGLEARDFTLTLEPHHMLNLLLLGFLLKEVVHKVLLVLFVFDLLNTLSLLK